jgi:ElaB/YqjD/DUF883 family membrane-anchored ribosome-binding protein
MSNNGHHTHPTVDTIADETRDLIEATADAADHKVVQARNRLTAALDAAKNTYTSVQKKAVNSAKATDKVIRANPYQAIGIAFGVGAVVGFLLSRRSKE